jgi:type I restriction enzyme S subunit
MHIVAGAICPSTKASVGREKAAELADYALSAGDVVIGRRGEMGRCAVVTSKETGWLIGTGSMAITPCPSLSPEFLQRFLSSPSVVRQLEASSAGSTMANLNQGALLRLPIVLASLQQQARIVAKLDALFARLARARTELDRVSRLSNEGTRARALLDRLEAAILTKAFKGELVPQDPSDEPASILLERIKAARNQQAQSQPKRGRKAPAPKALREEAVKTKGRQDEDVTNKALSG